VVADRVRLAQVFENLLTNAVKYGCRNDHPAIVIEGCAEDGEVRYCVRDNGTGIAPQFHERVFGLFERLDSDTEGTGVGLAAVSPHHGFTWRTCVGRIRSRPRCGVFGWRFPQLPMTIELRLQDRAWNLVHKLVIIGLTVCRECLNTTVHIREPRIEIR